MPEPDERGISSDIGSEGSEAVGFRLPIEFSGEKVSAAVLDGRICPKLPADRGALVGPDLR